jgi:hypothetical protein
MQKPNKSICIISFSPIYRDARVLRQIKYLSTFYDLNIIGYGQPHPSWVNMPNIKWISIDHPREPLYEKYGLKSIEILGTFIRKRLTRFLRPSLRPKAMAEYLVMFSGRFHPSFYEGWFWRKRQHIEALKYAAANDFDAILANDWNALPVAAEATKKSNARLVFDAHEYAPLELENRWYWRILFQPMIIYFLKKYVPQVTASLTVAQLIAERYSQEFDLSPIVVLNAPEKVTLPDRELDFNNIRLVHHGGAIRDRRLEEMIKTIAYCDQRFSLHFMLLNTDNPYLNRLKKLASELVPDRVIFHEPVPPEEIAQRISEYDMGIYLLEPNSYNNRVALPNKFFDFIAAGLAVCIGPSPSMAGMVRQYGLGCVAPSFNPHDVANMLNGLTKENISTMRLASLEACKTINAEIEMAKLIELCNRTLGSSQ